MKRLRQSTWAWPVSIALASLAGLVIGLVDDGLGDVLVWLGLALPVAVVIWAWRWGNPRGARPARPERD
ncbi:hypothetical protein EBB59_06215 [Lysobacter pythonis]|uniref:DUF4175 domain-containing protein n=1 Tax=Solilutibacter pythonis TaxID=2483112 RepID=A0A3M2HTS5_9GAMM|nr:hypothetical protein [Lysobacter pythonis]RMH93131.1 hypothetical protein EBB59_06215 [Lysobacter pythonis]